MPAPAAPCSPKNRRRFEPGEEGGEGRKIETCKRHAMGAPKEEEASTLRADLTSGFVVSTGKRKRRLAEARVPLRHRLATLAI